MSDILLTGKQIKKDTTGRPFVVTRVQRVLNNKYSSRFNEMKQLLDEKNRMEFIKRQGDLHEKETRELEKAGKP